jgi:hypothetical protein
MSQVKLNMTNTSSPNVLSSIVHSKYTPSVLSEILEFQFVPLLVTIECPILTWDTEY